MHEEANLIDNTPGQEYAHFLRNYRPFLKQSFHTIGSIRYPHVAGAPCPLTRNHLVWKYELNSKNKSNNASEYEDPWMKTLSNRKGFTAELAEAHERVESLLSELVRVYKTKVNTEVKKGLPQCDVDIDMAWELYDICANTCKLNKHPLFRVCAGFGAIHEPNPEKGEFMDRFRYIVHNKPGSKKECKELIGFENVQLVLTRSDVKYFFLSFDVYKGKVHNLYTPEVANNEKNVSAFNATNITKTTTNKKPQKNCRQLIHKSLIPLLEEDSKAKPGNVVVAWPRKDFERSLDAQKGPSQSLWCQVLPGRICCMLHDPLVVGSARVNQLFS
eukprot:941735-Prymnesium_polylepis.1